MQTPIEFWFNTKASKVSDLALPILIIGEHDYSEDIRQAQPEEYVFDVVARHNKTCLASYAK